MDDRETREQSQRPSGTRTARYRVLLVDDEPAVLRAHQRLLEASYYVAAASSVEEALRILSTGETFDLIMCDLTMPGLGGVELYYRIKTEHPLLKARVVFFSGGVYGERLQALVAETCCPVLQKPVAAAALRTVVEDFVKRASA